MSSTSMLRAGGCGTVVQPRSARCFRAIGAIKTRPVSRLLLRASHQVEAGSPSRRATLSIGVTGLYTVLVAPRAHAFLGLGDGIKDDEYAKDTTNILGSAKVAIGLDREAPERADKLKDVRNDINVWVAKYRREPKFSGRPSYGNTYSALNALAGHYNSFGTDAPIPKKRVDRMMKEFDDAARFLSRGR